MTGAWIALGGWAVVVAVASALPGAEVPGAGLPLGADKWGHAAAYAVLGWLAARAWSASGSRAWTAVVRAVALAAAFGATMEWMQEFVRRDPSVGDWAADALGATLGALAWRARHRQGPPPERAR